MREADESAAFTSAERLLPRLRFEVPPSPVISDR